MIRRKLGNSDLEITILGLGCWAMGGGGWAFAWGPQDDRESIAAIHAALDAGINWIDTAAVYGTGHAEEVLGKALSERSDKPLIFTKCGRVWDAHRQIGKCLKAASVRAECEASLRRLKVDVIDLYQIHWPEPEEEIEEGWEEMARLQQEGKVRYIGVSNFSVPQMERLQRIAPITSLQPPYSLLARGIEEEILPYAQRQGIGVLVYSPMKSGLLSGKMTRHRIATLPEDDFRRRVADFNEPLLTRNLELVELMREIGQAHGRTPGEVAIAWTLRHPAVTAAIVGLRHPQQLTGVIGAAEFRLTDEEAACLETFLAEWQPPAA